MNPFVRTFLVLILFAGCQPAPKNPDAPSAQVQPVATEAALQEDPLPFPVYLTYEEFEHHLHQFNDTTYVINFWATWCKPCVAELPYFEKLIGEVSNQPVRVWLVSMDFPKQIKNKLIPFVQERKLESHVLALADMDYNAWIGKVNEEWDGAIPFSLIYNAKTRVAKMGELDNYEELASLLKSVQ